MREYAYLCSKTKKNMEILRIPFKPITLEDEDIFSTEKIEERCNKEFHNDIGTIFDYYDIFDYRRNRKEYAKQYVDQSEWDELMHLRVKGQDLEKFRDAVKLFMELDAFDRAALPMLLFLTKMQQSISLFLEEESRMLEYVFPSKSELDFYSFDKYKIDHINDIIADYTNVDDLNESELAIIELLRKEREWDDDWQNTLKEVVNDPENYIGKVGDLCVKLANRIIDSFNQSITDFSDKHVLVVGLRDFDETHPVVYRFYYTFLSSMLVVRAMVSEYPDKMVLPKLLEIRSSLIKEFKQYRLGSLWYESIKNEQGLEIFSRYYINHREEFSEEEEVRFFYLFDKIRLITYVLTGKAEYFNYKAEYVYDSKEENPQVEAKAEAPSRFYSVVIVHSKAQEVIALIHRFLKGKTKSKDVAMPFRAAMEAGVIRRPTYGEFISEFGEGRISKSMFEGCCRPDNNPFYGEAYDKMVEMFQQLIKE